MNTWKEIQGLVSCPKISWHADWSSWDPTTNRLISRALSPRRGCGRATPKRFKVYLFQLQVQSTFPVTGRVCICTLFFLSSILSQEKSNLAQHPISPTLMNKPQNIWTPLPSALLQPRMHTPPSYPSFKPLHTRWRSGLDKPKRTASSAESIQKNLTASMMPRPSLPVDLSSAEGAVGLWCNVDHTAVKGGGLGGWNGFSWSYFLNMIYMTHLKCKSSELKTLIKNRYIPDYMFPYCIFDLSLFVFHERLHEFKVKVFLLKVLFFIFFINSSSCKNFTIFFFTNTWKSCSSTHFLFS